MKVPDRWLPYKAMGERIPGTRFISFKVPLKQAICNNLGERDRFSPQMLMDQCPDVQLVVDLTNTNKYYDKNTFTDAGVAYKKILTPGHVIPAKRCILEFFQTVDEFLAAAENDESLIGVHCTHGLNRTSYFVCCYMIHQLGFEPKNAVAAFETARGHKIERANYVTDLLSRGMGSDGHRERGAGAIEREPRGPGHRGPQQSNSRTHWDSRPIGSNQWDARSNRSGMERSHDLGQRNSRPHGAGQWDSRPNSSVQWDSRANSQWDPRAPRPSQSNRREKPYDRPPPNGHSQNRDFYVPSRGYSSSSRPNNTFYPFGDEDPRQRQQSSAPRVESNQQYSTYKEWRAARNARDQLPAPNQRPPPNHQQSASNGPSHRTPKPPAKTISKQKYDAEKWD